MFIKNYFANYKFKINVQCLKLYKNLYFKIYFEFYVAQIDHEAQKL